MDQEMSEKPIQRSITLKLKGELRRWEFEFTNSRRVSFSAYLESFTKDWITLKTISGGILKIKVDQIMFIEVNFC